jgi:hypothetical protein
MTSSSAYIIGQTHYGPKIKRDYASPPKRNKYNNLLLGQHKSLKHKTNTNKHFKTQYDLKLFASDKL